MEHSFTVVILIEAILLFHKEVLFQPHEYFKIRTTKILMRFHKRHLTSIHSNMSGHSNKKNNGYYKYRLQKVQIFFCILHCKSAKNVVLPFNP